MFSGSVSLAGITPQMMFPLVLELATDRIPIVVTCRVLGFSKQAFFKSRSSSVSQRAWGNAHLVNAAVDLHREEPAFGYRFISDEIETESGLSASPAAGVAAVLRAAALECVLEEAWPESESWAAGA